MRDANVACHGLIIGGADERKAAYATELRELVQQWNLSQYVSFLGHRNDLRELYSISSIVLSLSTKPEAFGRTVAEALAIGTPVVGYAHGGVEEILRTAFPAGLVPLGDPDALTSIVRSLLTHSEPPQVLPSIYSRQSMQEKTVGLYEKLGRRSSDDEPTTV